MRDFKSDKSVASKRSGLYTPVNSRVLKKITTKKSKGKYSASTISLVSMRSDQSRGQPLHFGNQSISVSRQKHRSSGANLYLCSPTTLRGVSKVFESAVLIKLTPHKRVISAKKHILDKVKEEPQSHYGFLELYQRQLKLLLKQKNECLLEELRTQQGPVPLTKIYTKVYLREGRGEVNQEHEIRQIEQAFNKQKTPESPSIDNRDIFRPFSDRDTSVRIVLTTGIAGIGKTVLVQKFILDWCEGRAHQDVQLLFPLTFRELNLLQNQRKTLMELLQDFCPGLKESRITDVSQYKVLVVLDGLDECRLHLDFTTNYKYTDAATAMPVEALLTNLIKGNLLPNAQLWITTRPAAAGSVPPTLIHRVTEIRGFNNLQKEAYFLKKIQDEDLSRRVITTIRSCPPLYSMCHLPGFCWIAANVFVKTSTRTTLTQIYVHFLRYHMMKMQQKYGQDRTRVNKVILSLSKLAFEQLQKRNSIFYEEDLKECGLDIKEAAVYSGICTQVFREDTCGGHKIFYFVHLSVQEFLAALYVHVSFCEDGVNLMEKKQRSSNLPLSHLPLSHLHRSAVDTALGDQQGHLDLFLRFLLGLSLESSQSLLTQLHIQGRGCEAESHRQTVDYLQQQISLCPDPHRYINLFHCLNELNEHSLLQEKQTRLDSDKDSDQDNRPLCV